MSNTRDAFLDGWRSIDTDPDDSLDTARGVQEAFPEYSAREVTAFLNGRDDALCGDTFRLRRLT